MIVVATLLHIHSLTSSYLKVLYCIFVIWQMMLENGKNKLHFYLKYFYVLGCFVSDVYFVQLNLVHIPNRLHSYLVYSYMEDWSLFYDFRATWNNFIDPKIGLIISLQINYLPERNPLRKVKACGDQSNNGRLWNLLHEGTFL